MTTPTQAQIEAAAKAFHEQACDGDWPCTFCLDGAEAALTAAAEMGKDPYADWMEARKHEVELAKLATIERCAQVADDFAESGCEDATAIAAAIRKLKDEPAAEKAQIEAGKTNIEGIQRDITNPALQWARNLTAAAEVKEKIRFACPKCGAVSHIRDYGAISIEEAGGLILDNTAAIQAAVNAAAEVGEQTGLVAEIHRQHREIERLRARNRELVRLLDDQLGTPCEQIRHAQEIEATIERCAQMAEQHCCEECGAQIAAAIRAFKQTEGK